MKKLIYSALWILMVSVFVLGCKEDDPTLGDPPTEEDAVFAFEATPTNANEIVFSAESAKGIKKWDFGNGQKAEGNTVSTKYIFAGDYVVTLTVYASGGFTSQTQNVHIENTDLTMLPEVYTLLTGGVDYPEGKTWVIDATRAGHMGIGPKLETSPIWWSAPANDKADAGLYNDKYTFTIAGFKYTQDTEGDVFLNKDHGAAFPGAFENKGDMTAPYIAPTNLTWTIIENNDNTFTLNLSNGGFIGYYTGVFSYQILSISENEMFIKFYDSAHPDFAWFHRLVPDGFEPPPSDIKLPLDFETSTIPFVGFGGSTYEQIANPVSGGINTSAKVGKYVKGGEANWAGIVTQLTAKIDFSSKPVLKWKVYSPVAGKALLKIESSDNGGDPIEKFATVTKVDEWEELSFDFTDVPSNVYDKIALFLDFDNNNGGTFYIDDIRQSAEESVLTLAALTGATSKTWKLKPAAGSFGVGPGKGDLSWWPGGADISGDRPCLFNDEFIFKTGGVYQYDTKGDIWGEAYMGLTPDGCTNDTNLPANAAAWGSGTHTFVFTPSDGTHPATIAVTGTGAFIALPKAFNGGEYSAAPPVARTVTYEVLSYVKNGSTETLSIAVDIPGGFWNFVLVSQN